MSRHVLIGFAESLAAIETAWCLLDHGFEITAFTRKGTRPALVYARDKRIRIVEISSPEQGAGASAADLMTIIRDLAPDAVLPLDDHAVWLCDKAYADFAAGEGSHLPPLAGPQGKLALIALDKREQFRAASNVGLSVPPTADLSDLTAVELPGNGPWMVKPATAVQLRDGRMHRPTGSIVTTETEAREVASRVNGPVVAQPIIKGTGEGIFGLTSAGSIVAWSAHRRIRMMNPRGSGSSACCSIPVPAELADKVSAFISEIGWQGLFMMEFLRDTAGTPWFMELNGRTWGSMALARRRGYAYPAWAVHLAIDDDYLPGEPTDAPHLTARHLGREVVHLAAVLRSGDAPRAATVRDVLTVRSSDRWYNWRRGEGRVFAADSWTTVRKQLGGRLPHPLRALSGRNDRNH